MKKIIIAFISLCLLSGCYNKKQISNDLQFVIDSGSSGNRIYVYKITDNNIQSIYESSNKIGLSSFKNNPLEANKAISPLLDSALSFIKTNYVMNPTNIRTSVLATAGMRLIDNDTQNIIYNRVSDTILEHDLSIGDVKTISGQDEGIYSWVDVNYLQGNFNNYKTNGIVEIGGASAQVALETNESNEYTKQIRINKKNYNIYSISLLGLGQDQAFNNIQKTEYGNDCLINNYNNGHFNLTKCNYAYNKLINNYIESINNIKNINNFSKTNFIGLSSIYYAFNFWNIDQNNYQILPMINGTCYSNWSDLQLSYPNNKYLYTQCANSVYINQLLFGHLQINHNQINIIDEVDNNSLTWTLGYIILNTSK